MKQPVESDPNQLVAKKQRLEDSREALANCHRNLQRNPDNPALSKQLSATLIGSGLAHKDMGDYLKDQPGDDEAIAYLNLAAMDFRFAQHLTEENNVLIFQELAKTHEILAGIENNYNKSIDARKAEEYKAIGKIVEKHEQREKHCFFRSHLWKNLDSLDKVIAHSQTGGTLGFGSNQTLEVLKDPQDLGWIDENDLPTERCPDIFRERWNLLVDVNENIHENEDSVVSLFSSFCK